MIEKIQTNKLLFLDIETCGCYSTLGELEDKNTILFNLWNKMGDSYLEDIIQKMKECPKESYLKNILVYYLNSVG